MNLHPSSQNKPRSSEFCRKKSYRLCLRTNHGKNKCFTDAEGIPVETCNTCAMLIDTNLAQHLAGKTYSII